MANPMLGYRNIDGAEWLAKLKAAMDAAAQSMPTHQAISRNSRRRRRDHPAAARWRVRDFWGRLVRKISDGRVDAPRDVDWDGCS